jgi:phosphate transport system permease protein
VATAVLPEGAELLRASGTRLRFRVGFDRWISYLLPLLYLVAILPIADLVWWVSVRALPTMSWSVLTNTSPLDTHSLAVPIISTFYIMAFATTLAVVFGLFGGIATAEFLPERIAGWVRTSANLLAGTPSVVIGYFGFFAFVLYFGWGLNVISGSFTLAFFMLPYLFRTVDLAYTSVPRQIREAAFGAGTRPVQYLLRIATPIAFPQVLNGVFLAMAIGVGETAPLYLTLEQSALVPTGVFQPASFLTGQIWENYTSPPGTPGVALAFESAFLLLVVVVVLNIVVRFISARFRRRVEGLFQ